MISSVICLQIFSIYFVELAALKALLFEVDEYKFPCTELVLSLREAVESAEKCTIVGGAAAYVQQGVDTYSTPMRG